MLPGLSWVIWLNLSMLTAALGFSGMWGLTLFLGLFLPFFSDVSPGYIITGAGAYQIGMRFVFSILIGAVAAFVRRYIQRQSVILSKAENRRMWGELVLSGCLCIPWIVYQLLRGVSDNLVGATPLNLLVGVVVAVGILVVLGIFYMRLRKADTVYSKDGRPSGDTKSGKTNTMESHIINLIANFMGFALLMLFDLIPKYSTTDYWVDTGAGALLWAWLTLVVISGLVYVIWRAGARVKYAEFARPQQVRGAQRVEEGESD